MNRASVAALALALPIAFVACLGRSQMTQERLRDSVVGYNDELRFGRMDLAVQRVAPPLRAAFVGGHYRWGREITIADAELVNVEAVGEDYDRAVSFVTFRWYATGSTIVRETLVRQEWVKDHSTYALVAEAVIDGDPILLAIPDGFRPEASALTGSNDGGVDGAIDPDAGVAPSP